jgi:hypothetical protein
VDEKARLTDFAYPGEDPPAGVTERGMPAEVLGSIAAIAGDVRRGLDAFSGRRMDCRHACSAWQSALRVAGHDVVTSGGEGVDDEVFTSNYRLVSRDRRSGYRQLDDDVVHRHYWLEVGADRLIFDPTAHQFDSKGGVRLDRYTIDGEPRRG